MGIRETVLERIKEEIVSDPDGLGYSGKTDAEILALIKKKVVKMEPREYPQPLLRIINRIAEGPNDISLQDVTDAKALIT